MTVLLAVMLAAELQGAPPPIYIDIGGEWRKSADDRMEYASPDFDDTRWEVVELPWGGRDIPGRFWLRRPVQLVPGVDRSDVTIRMGPVAPVYELYANGVRIGATGPFEESSARVARARSFRLPPSIASGDKLELALRVLRPTYTMGRLSRGGDYLLVYFDRNIAGAEADSLVVTNLSMLVLGSLRLFMAMVLLVLWLSERQRMELFWLGGFVSASAGSSLVTFASLWPETAPLELLRYRDQLDWITGALLAELTLTVFAARAQWMRILVWGVWIASQGRGSMLYIVGDLLTLGLLAFGWWKSGGRRLAGNRQGIAVSLLLVVLTHMNRQQSGTFILGLPQSFLAGGINFGLLGFVVTVLALILTVLLIRQLGSDRREKQRLAGELEAARAVQQLLLTKPALRDGGLKLDAVYEPAQEVGGDFYYVLDGETVVVGDVSGKGLKAAMLVSLLVGILRETPQRSPSAVLGALNRGVAAQLGGTGFVTCCCARFGSGGSVMVANAGHPAPYLNGTEVSLPDALPLGFDEDAMYEEAAVALGHGSTLTFVSDGVVEAASAAGELFGFDRTREASKLPAKEIAVAAKAWGQTDDITVVTVRRTS